MKLSIVILCWNDLKVIGDCLRSLYGATRDTEFEVIVPDNGSTDGSPEFVRRSFPDVRVLENGANLGFAKGNNTGIRASQGELILILNPDTVVHDGALDRLVAFADRHPEAGAFGCRVVNPDGSYQLTTAPFPSIWRYWMNILRLHRLAQFATLFRFGGYLDWHGDTERTVDWQSGCCVMFRAHLLKRLGGFDEQFFYTYEEVDLCRRVWNAGYSILFTPEASVTHLHGQSVSRFPLRFELEKQRNGYRYFYKHFGPRGARRLRYAQLVALRRTQLKQEYMTLLRPSAQVKDRLRVYRVVVQWTKLLDPVRFVEEGQEPDIEQVQLALHDS